MTDFDKECDLLKQYLKASIEFLPSMVMYRLKTQGIMWVRGYTTFEEWKRENKWITNLNKKQYEKV